MISDREHLFPAAQFQGVGRDDVFLTAP